MEEIDQPVIVSAQAVPEQREAGGAERGVALTDRVWFKVKTSDHRAAVTELRGTDLPAWVRPSRGAWWIGAAGRRQADSAQRDFYATLQRECTTGKTVSSDHFAPGRLGLEAPRCRTGRRVAARDEANGDPARRDIAEDRPPRSS